MTREWTVPDNTLPFRIAWIARLQRSRFDARARELGLTSAQWRVIASIRFAEGSTQIDIASRLEISGVTAGRIIDRLDERGWVERRADPDDLRARRLYLTPVAKPMLDGLSALAREEEKLSLEGLSQDDLAVFGSLLDRVLANMLAAPPVDLPVQEHTLQEHAADGAAAGSAEAIAPT